MVQALHHRNTADTFDSVYSRGAGVHKGRVRTYVRGLSEAVCALRAGKPGSWQARFRFKAQQSLLDFLGTTA